MEQFIIMSPDGIPVDYQYYNCVKYPCNISLEYDEIGVQTGKALAHKLLAL
jgi:hypothetical protein